MTGPQGGAYADRGLIPRTLECLFQTLESATAADGDIDGVVTVRVSHLEIYVRPLPRVILGHFRVVRCILLHRAHTRVVCGCVSACVFVGNGRTSKCLTCWLSKKIPRWIWVCLKIVEVPLCVGRLVMYTVEVTQPMRAPCHLQATHMCAGYQNPLWPTRMQRWAFCSKVKPTEQLRNTS